MMRVMMKIEYNEEDDHEEGDDEDDDGDYERKAETKSEWWGHSYLLLPTNRWLAWLLGGGRGFALRASIQFLTFDNDANIDQFWQETGQNWLGHFYDSWGVADFAQCVLIQFLNNKLWQEPGQDRWVNSIFHNFNFFYSK